mmetsp:Transcript_59277/g.118663  ORF Transcript_59277/g.118663 Transcript_59277/m.118663 type:complete len:197 (-) Transcript_59277:50-640(-)
MAPGSRSRACALLWAHQVLVLDLVVLSFVGVSSLADPAGLAHSVQEGAGTAPGNATVSQLDRDLARSTGPATLAVAFLCARSLWRSLGSKRDALVVMVAFHICNLVVMGLQLWEDIGGGSGATLPELVRRLPSSKVALVNCFVGLAVVLCNALAVASCDHALAVASRDAAALASAGTGSSDSDASADAGREGRKQK